MSEITKGRYWVGVLYPENMIEGWQDKIDELLQIPFAYCIHDKDNIGTEEERKVHVHLFIVFSNTTTKKHAMNVFNVLSASGKSCLSSCQAVLHPRNQYEYLTHNTDKARKDGKHQYDKSERIEGNNFDIGAYEQLGLADRNRICKDLCQLITDNDICNFADFYLIVMSTYGDDSSYFDVLKSYSGLFERLTKGNYQRYLFNRDNNS